MKWHFLLLLIFPVSVYSQEVYSGVRVSGNFLHFLNDNPSVTYQDKKSLSTAISLTNFFGNTVGVETEILFRSYQYEISFPLLFTRINQNETPVRAQIEGMHAEVPLLIDIRLVNHTRFGLYLYSGVAQALLIGSHEKIYFSNGVMHEMNVLNNEVRSFRYGMCVLYKTKIFAVKFRCTFQDFVDPFDVIIKNQLQVYEAGFEIDYHWNN